ncbi:MAG: phenylacetate-CoA oxygenase subunit PaaC [Puia sp.]|nr:phenylacetate-CoA oxygenase subunit PaaC [Puia sp.]
MRRDQHIHYLLHLADDSLILGHRNSEWTGHGPILEQDIALSNISLDLIGQARNLYQYAARLVNRERGMKEKVLPGVKVSGEVSEDTLAYFRDSRDYKNCLLVEQPNGDWGKTVLRQFLFSAFQFLLYDRLKQRDDQQVAAIAEKSIKEVAYHLRWSSEWVIRLGDGTAESHRRMRHALEDLWLFTGELFVAAPYEQELLAEGYGADLSSCRLPWEDTILETLARAGLFPPEDGTSNGSAHTGSAIMTRSRAGGKEGQHTEHLGYLLAEMQFLQRAYPGCEW